MKRILRILALAVIGGAILVSAASAQSWLPWFGVDDKEKKEVDVLSESIEPRDMLVTQDENIIVQKGEERYTVKLKDYGKNSILITTKLENGKDVKLLRRVLRIPVFKDVPEGYWAKKEIELTVASGLISKQRSAYYRPDSTLTKENFVRTLVKAMKLNPPAVTGKVANDIDAKNANAKYINYVVNVRKLMDLDANGNFNPGQKITKGEAIVAFCKLGNIEENWNMAQSPFEDLPPRHKYARYISAAEKAGMLEFALKRGYLDADSVLTSAEMACLVAKTNFGKKAIADLLDWKTGYGVNVDKKNIIALSE